MILKQEVQVIVNRHIPTAKLDYHTGKEKVSFLLPFGERDKFVGLFEELDKFTQLKMNLELNSLEDAFINIAKLEELEFAFSGNEDDLDSPLPDTSNAFGVEQFVEQIPESFCLGF
jgi:hypothetical protein